MKSAWKLAATIVLLVASLQATASKLLPSEQTTINIFQRIAPLVVNVHRFRTVLTQGFVLRDVQSGMASGFIWNKEGYVVTNYHVIQQANKVAVTLQKGKTVQAKIIGALPRKDIAVLKIEDTSALEELHQFKQFPLADSSQLQVGQQTIAIGNPFGLDRTLTTGVISALGREVPGIAGNIRDMIQTDASINPGNSGGPLLNSQGQLIGMNTLIFSRSGGSAGIGFAVPTNDIKRIVEQFIRFGRVRQPGIGIQLFSDEISRFLGLKGVIISDVVPDTPAAQAGLKGSFRRNDGRIELGDIIIKVNGETIKHYTDLLDELDRIKIGETITLTIRRDKETIDVKVPTIDVYAKESQ